MAVFEGRPVAEGEMRGLEAEDEIKLPNWWQRLMRM